MWAVLLLSACGLRHVARFEPVFFELQPSSTPLQEALVVDLHRGRLTEIQVHGRTLDDDAVRVLPPEVALGVFSVAKRWARNAEIDMLVPGAKGLRPVTVLTEGSVVHVDYSDPIPTPPADAPASTIHLAAVASRHGLSAIEAGSAAWSEGELKLLDLALARLSPEVRQVLTATRWQREGLSPRAGNRELAWFDPTREPPSVQVYGAAFDAGVGAVGPVDDMQPAAVMTILHEVAHAVADWPLRQAFVAVEQAEGPAARADAQERLHALGRRGPVIDAWAQVRDGPGPTPYGAHNLHESFAEAMSLFLLDPDALRRVMPEAADWFARGGHLHAAGLVRQ